MYRSKGVVVWGAFLLSSILGNGVYGAKVVVSNAFSSTTQDVLDRRFSYCLCGQDWKEYENISNYLIEAAVLIRSGANPSRKFRECPLHRVVDASAAALLLCLPSTDINVLDSKGRSPLFACTEDYLCEYMVKNSDCFEFPSEEMRTMIYLLIDCKANPFLEGPDEETPRRLVQKYIDNTKVLLEKKDTANDIKEILLKVEKDCQAIEKKLAIAEQEWRTAHPDEDLSDEDAKE
ncbi:MAG: hypothetical protein LBR92_00225 [Puniceicoccales bacterium]|jgi:hypothetical protein|nr:hypothetical protein [Puniceicoccales bacterium]